MAIRAPDGANKLEGPRGKSYGKVFFLWRYLLLVYRCILIVGYYVSERRVRVLSQQSLS